MESRPIILKNVRVHTLKGVDLTLEPNELIVFTGVSGSGKSSLAFDTIYVEGQRRYVESLSTYARRQMGDMQKPDMERAEGISPTISIEQKTAGKNPRSTVGTMTEIYDYMRVLYARIGVPHCPISGERVLPQSRERIIRTAQTYPKGTKMIVLAPFAKEKKAEFKEDFQELIRKGFMRARVDGEIISLDDKIALDGNVAHNVDVVIDRLVVNEESGSRIAEALTQALQFGEGVCAVLDSETDTEQLFSMHAYSPKSGLSYDSLEPHDFSFNSPSGMCPRCQGMGIVQEFDLDLVIDPNKSIADDCCSVASSYQTVRFGNIYTNLADINGFSVRTPWKKLSKEAQDVFLYGTKKKWTRMRFVHPETGAVWMDHVQWRGVLHEAHTRFTEAKSDNYRNNMRKLMHEQLCPACHGSRLKPYPAAATLGHKPIFALTAMNIAELALFIETLSLTKQEQLIAEELLKEIRVRLHFLLDVGLHYLTLDRTSPTLSGGEAQRVRLASQIGCGLVGITYILDEPSIGLHPRDNKKLISTLQHLKEMGNTVIVVEHDEETIWEADRVVDFGPLAGSKGGEILVNGTVHELLKNKTSLTGAYLSGRKEIAIPKKRRKPGKKALTITKAAHHNLKKIDVKIPLGVMTAVTGVSGSGKSSLITDILYPALANTLHKAELPVGAHQEIKGLEEIDKVIAIDQSPIGRNPRSNPATYIKLFDEIRDLFSSLPESQARGFKPGRFSFNVREGSCPQCSGMGMVKIDMDFMEDAWVECPLCQNRRFDPETLSVHFKGKNIHDVLEMDVDTAHHLFAAIPSIQKKLETLQKVGMGYIKLGQSSTTLSGGEAQRIKLAKELVRPSTGQTLYILDEPTTGLHFYDIEHLLTVLNTLVERGNSVLVIEHNMDVIKTVDWIIDLGPEGGAGGGEVVATGTPEAIAKMDTPTGHAVHAALHYDPKSKEKALKKRSKPQMEPIQTIRVTGAEQNNLKSVSVEIPREKLTVFTGPSGSGKSSLAFDTIYAEGQRRYIESLSPYARQFVKQMAKPKVGHVEGLSPAIAIEQKAHAGNPRSTVGTMTEIYDYLRILYARLGIAYSPETGKRIQAISKDHVVDRLLDYPEGTKVEILAPIDLKKNERFEDVLGRLKRQGYVRIRLNGQTYDLDQEIPYDKKRRQALCLVIDRLKINPTIKTRLFEAVENASTLGQQHLIVNREGEDIPFNLAFSDETGKAYPEITPHTFAFNKAEGMCPDCLGLGTQYGANLSQHGEWISLSASGLLHTISGEWADTLISFIEDQLDVEAPLSELSSTKLQWFLNGATQEETEGTLKYRWLGVNHVLAKAAKSARTEIREGLIPMLDEQTCPSCQGTRLNPLARAVELEGITLPTLCQWPVEKVLPFVDTLPRKEKVLDEVITQATNRLRFLCEVGIHYMALERRAPSLSGGEAQRIRLARQLGSGLTGVLYVLDEPTIGLHPRDNGRLNNALQKLRALGNTMLIVEHDPQTIQTADKILDFGPAAGLHGGHITAQGTYKQILKDRNSLTGAYLSGKKQVPIPAEYRKLSKETLQVRKANLHNLKNISVDISIGCFTCFTGVSGSGKSTLMHDVIRPAVEKGLHKMDKVEKVSGISHFDRLISINQDPIGHTVRSDVGTYVEALDAIRTFFASLPAAKIKGLQPRHFSTNHIRGMCGNCWGLGYKKVQMHFLPPVRVVCEECEGLRLNPVSLEILYQGKNLGQILDCTIDECAHIFAAHPKITRILNTLIQVGLGYLKLGQEMVSLSGGEAQRIKLSRELAKRSTGKTLYLLDEPTTGLHPDDIVKLLKVLQALVDKGNTLVVIEHNLDMIRNADYIFDLGPEAGEAGGYIVAKGRVADIQKSTDSWTGKYL